MTLFKDYKCNHGILVTMPCNECVVEAELRFAGKAPKKGTIYIKPDMVNQPPHYKVGGIETIDYLQAKLSPEEYRGYLRGNALKYLSRAGQKDNTAQDYSKAIWYIERLLSVL